MKIDPIQVSALIERIAEDDAAAFRQLEAMTHGYLTRAALQILRRPDLAEDAVQQTYLAVWRHAKSFDVSKAKGPTWLSVILKRKAIDILRVETRLNERTEKLRMLQEREIDMVITNPEIDACTQIKTALERLGREQRTVIEKAYFQQFTHAEIATQMGRPLGTIKSWIRRGLLTLRDELSPATFADLI